MFSEQHFMYNMLTYQKLRKLIHTQKRSAVDKNRFVPTHELNLESFNASCSTYNFDKVTYIVVLNLQSCLVVYNLVLFF